MIDSRNATYKRADAVLAVDAWKLEVNVRKARYTGGGNRGPRGREEAIAKSTSIVFTDSIDAQSDFESLNYCHANR